MKIVTIDTLPFDDQNPGTSGLRKKTEVFQNPTYVENFITAIFKASGRLKGGILVLGGDGRYYNDVVIQKILKMAIAFEIRRVIVGQNGILSTPCASHLIRTRQAEGGIILSASHNPAGPDKDFGIKYNTKNGGPATEDVTGAIYNQSKNISFFSFADVDDFDISKEHTIEAGSTTIEVLDTTKIYADLMESLFDFSMMKTKIKEQNLKIRFDAMNAVTGGYAREIFVNRLGLDESSLLNCVTLSDFGGLHPDPNPTNTHELISVMKNDSSISFGSASDGDGDRNMIVGGKSAVVPSDSLAILCANSQYLNGLKVEGVARSMPTSGAVDRVAKELNMNCYETPTGWKFFGSLLDAGKITLCGEESYGTGSNHVREKDGLWTILAWLSILTARNMSVDEIVEEHWAKYGRDYFLRNDYNVSSEQGANIYNSLASATKSLKGTSVDNVKILDAYVFNYEDPINGNKADNQGVILDLENESRLVYRLSGTGTVGATLRVYVSAYDKNDTTSPVPSKLNAVSILGAKLAKLQELANKDKPDLSVF